MKRSTIISLVIIGLSLAWIIWRQIAEVGAWALLTVPVTLLILFGVIFGLNALFTWADRRDAAEPTKVAAPEWWIKLWRSKRDR